MFYFSNFWRYTKLTFTSIGGVLAFSMLITGLVLGAGIKSTIIVIGGSIFLVQSVLLFFDSSKVQAVIEQHLNKLEDDIHDFETQNMQQLVNITNFVEENKKLLNLFNKSQTQLEKMVNLKDDYKKENYHYQELLNQEKIHLVKQEEQVKLYQTENEELKESISNMRKIVEDYTSEQNEYQNIKVQMQEQIHKLEITKISAIQEVEELQKLHQQDLSAIKEQQIQVSKLKELYLNSLELLDNLRKTGDMFTSFGTSIGESITEIQTTADSLDATQSGFDQTLSTFQNLIEKLKLTTFEKLDQNADGNITKYEFDQNLSKL